MSYEPVDTVEHLGMTIKIYPDFDPLNPRKDWDTPVTEMVCSHGRYDLGDRELDSDETRALERGGFRLLERYLRMTRGVIAIKKLGLYDHSGLHMYAGGGSYEPFDSAGWDSGTVGFIYITKEAAEKELGYTDPDKIEKFLMGEIEEYDQYLRGDVYGYVTENKHGEEMDSCWGFFGYDYAVEQAKANIKPDDYKKWEGC